MTRWPVRKRGKQIGERFAGAGAGLDDEMAALGKGSFDGSRHFKLAGAVLVRQRGAGEDAARRKELVEAGQRAGWGVRDGHEPAAQARGAQVP